MQTPIPFELLFVTHSTSKAKVYFVLVLSSDLIFTVYFAYPSCCIPYYIQKPNSIPQNFILQTPSPFPSHEDNSSSQIT
jgi:hypothetical protein